MYLDCCGQGTVSSAHVGADMQQSQETAAESGVFVGDTVRVLFAMYDGQSRIEAGWTGPIVEVDGDGDVNVAFGHLHEQRWILASDLGNVVVESRGSLLRRFVEAIGRSWRAIAQAAALAPKVLAARVESLLSTAPALPSDWRVAAIFAIAACAVTWLFMPFLRPLPAPQRPKRTSAAVDRMPRQTPQRLANAPPVPVYRSPLGQPEPEPPQRHLGYESTSPVRMMRSRAESPFGPTIRQPRGSQGAGASFAAPLPDQRRHSPRSPNVGE